MFGYDQATATSIQLCAHFSRIAETSGCHFLDASLVTEPSPIDALHLDLEGHKKLGLAIAGMAASIFEKDNL